MSEHYYSQQPHSKTDEQKHRVSVAQLNLDLWTDHGVFAKTGLDYGSRVLITALMSQPLVAGDILDVGCGYGPIGISLAKIHADKQVHMLDINERAVTLANRNCLENNVSNAQAQQSYLYEQVSATNYALVVSNPPIRAGKQVVHSIIEESYHYLVTGGKLAIVIQKKQGAPSAEKKMMSVFGNVTLVDRDKGYWILVSQKNEKEGEGEK